MTAFRLLLLLLCGVWHHAATAQHRLDYTDWEPVLVEDFDSYTSIADMAERSVWQLAPDDYRTLLSNSAEDEYYDPSALSLRKGKLLITAQWLVEPINYRFKWQGRDSSKTLRFSSGWISLRQDYWSRLKLGDSAHWDRGRGITYGLFEIRCRLPSGGGTWPAFWLYSGPTEIDVFEAGTDSLNRPTLFSNNVHQNNEPRSFTQRSYTKFEGANLSQRYFTYSAVWTPQEVRFYLNRRLLRTVPMAEIQTHGFPAIVIANLAVLNSANINSWPTTKAGPRTTMAIDYIKVYKPRDGSLRSGRNVYATPPALPKQRR